MSLLAPLTLLLFLPLGAIVVVLYLLKLRRKDKTVSSVQFWLDATADIQANAPFQRLKKNLLLFLQLAALLMLAFALARPYVRTRAAPESRVVAIIDASASMQSRDVRQSRLEAAKSRARGLAQSMGVGDRMLVISAGARARVVISFTKDKRALNAAISGIRPSDAECDMRQAMTLALSLIAENRGRDARVVVYSDGGFDDLSSLSGGDVKLSYQRIGRRSENVGITAIDSRRTPSGNQQVFVGVRNFGLQNRRTNLEVYLNDKLIDVRELNLLSRGSAQEVIEGIGEASGRIIAKIALDDDLAVDDTATAYLARHARIEALLVTKGNVFLENALLLDKRIDLVRGESVPEGLAAGEYALVVFDRVSPPGPLPPGGYLLIGTSTQQAPAAVGQAVTSPSIVDWNRKSPVTAFVDPVGMRIAKAQYLRPKPWAESLLDGPGGPLAVAGVDRATRFVQLGFDILDSDFPLRVSFPVFMANCVDWLVPSFEVSSGRSVKVGRSVELSPPSGVGTLTVKMPDGSSRTVKVNGSPVVFDSTDQAGLYKVRGSGYETEFACNVVSSNESDTTPRDTVVLGRRKFSARSGGVSANTELYGVLAALALAVLAFEWYAYHRRI